ncbi:uncharacterized protein KY384_008274 [Bacidia gigantensis]|uniref:uncharacterized protein n=1 Tax=Bacidia gigantensis TaxID=2732470 RepID=UPI001D03DC11|nr:uncharacterized protein KY384_008274 [Bacidia gigantensis]KAG8526845.1 hypothetical protein KY384_008274 [Bacidia gigantensis]
MDMQGTPVGGLSASKKVTSDPESKQYSKQEGAGAVTSDSLAVSLAAESAGSGGAFEENRDSNPSGTGAGLSGSEDPSSNYVGEGNNSNERSTSGQNYSSSTTGSGGSASGREDTAPGYVSSVTQPFNSNKVKGSNISEGSEEDFKGPSTQDAEIGSENDPGRRAENDFQRMTQQSSGSTAPRQGGKSDEGQYGALSDDQNL